LTAGLTSTGFTPKTATEIADEIAATQRATIDPTLDTSAESVVGNLNAVMATKLRELWELAELVYGARSPRNASFSALDDLCAITGTTRAPATKGTVSLRLTVAAGRTIPAGSVAHVAGDTTNRWVTLADAVNTTGSSAQITVAAEAETAGVRLAYAGTLTTIATPVSGWSAVTNLADATPGRAVETDAALRLRREREIQGPGAGTVGAITAALSAVLSVRQAVVFENPTDTPVDGIPAHSFEALVLGGADADIRAALWKAKPAGIRAHGSTSGTTLDTEGVARVVAFTRPTELAVYVSLAVGARRDTYAGDAAVEAAVVAWGDSLLAGDPVRIARIIETVMGVAGVEDVVAFVGLASGAVYPVNLAVALRARATFDTSRITVASVLV